MASLAQIEANRKNALRSTGPKTPEGKLASRRNAMKHGFRAELLVAPTEADLLPDFHMTYRSELKCQDGVDLNMAREMGLMCLRLDRLHLQSSNAEEELRRRELTFFDEKLTIAASKLAKGLAEDPEPVALELEQSSAGCHWKMVRWEALAGALEEGRAWDDTLRKLALDLLGVDPALRPIDRQAKALAKMTVEAMSELADDEIGRLEARRDAIARDLEEPERQAIADGFRFISSPELALLRRYEGICAHRLHRTMLSYQRRQDREGFRGNGENLDKKLISALESFRELLARNRAERARQTEEERRQHRHGGLLDPNPVPPPEYREPEGDEDDDREPNGANPEPGFEPYVRSQTLSESLDKAINTEPSRRAAQVFGAEGSQSLEGPNESTTTASTTDSGPEAVRNGSR